MSSPERRKECVKRVPYDQCVVYLAILNHDAIDLFFVCSHLQLGLIACSFVSRAAIHVLPVVSYLIVISASLYEDTCRWQEALSEWQIGRVLTLQLHMLFAALASSAAYAVMRSAVSVCLSVRRSRSWHILKMISPSGSHAILVFHTKRHNDIPTGTLVTGASNAGGVGRNRDSEPISGFTACCEEFQRQVQYT